VQTFGSTTALTTQASIVLSALSARSYAIQASFSGDNVYAPSTSSTLNQVLTPPSVGMTPTINEVVNGGSFLPEIQAVSWVSIFGSGLASVGDPGVSGPTTEIASGFLPTSLKGVKRHHQGQQCVRLFDPNLVCPLLCASVSRGATACWWLSVVCGQYADRKNGQIGRSEHAVLALILRIIRAQYRSVRVIGESARSLDMDPRRRACSMASLGARRSHGRYRRTADY
jgi:hypothetical protein